MQNRHSLLAYLASVALIVASVVFYYPKWKMKDTEATLSWDVSGYYLYLPATFIYKDIKQLTWWDGVNSKYHPGPGMGQAFKHPSGNYVMKYPMGQALQFLPWFTVAHLVAEPLGYPADGFSRPYQAAVSWGSLLVMLLGLWVLRRVLLRYFSDGITAAVLISLAFGSNYLEYAGITGAMTHNWLFTLYALLVYGTIRFYEKPTLGWAALIGLCVGWATLTRPTEIISLLIPLFWGVHSKSSLLGRLDFFKSHLGKIGLAAGVAAVLMFFQSAYWKYATGEWLVYSYEEQGFTWFPPHIEDVLWSAKAGWLVYSPMMILAVAGLFMLRKCLPALFPAIALYCLTALYITSAWDIWWYGGSLGQRAMVQAYPLWAFALGAFWYWASQKNLRRLVLVALGGVFIYLNLWWCHQAHRGGAFIAEQMTRRYMMKVLGRFEREQEWLKFLDTRDEFSGDTRQDVRLLLSENFDADTTNATTADAPIAGARSLIIDGARQFSPAYKAPLPQGPNNWVRATVTFRCNEKEWEYWAMTQFIVRFKSGDKIVKDRMVRLQRHVEGSEQKTLSFDTKTPKTFDSLEVLFWNPGSNKTLRLDDLQLESFH